MQMPYFKKGKTVNTENYIYVLSLIIMYFISCTKIMCIFSEVTEGLAHARNAVTVFACEYDRICLCCTSCNDHFIINHSIKGNQESHFRHLFI